MSTALGIVQRYFPQVEDVTDATKGTAIEVTRTDTSSAKRRSHRTCAMAVACKRKLNLDGVIISVKTAYLVKGTKAIRYLVPESVSREIVSFDRGSDFAPGDYKLIVPQVKLGLKKNGKGHGPHGRPDGRTEPRHFTGGIRTVLGSSKDIS